MAVGIKVVTHLTLKKGDYPRLVGWVQNNHSTLKCGHGKLKRKSDDIIYEEPAALGFEDGGREA